MDALAKDGHDVIPIGISKTGRFLVGGDPLRALSSGDFTGEQSATMLPEPGGTGLVRVVNGLPDAGGAGHAAMVHGLPEAGGTVHGPVVDGQLPMDRKDVSDTQASAASLDVLFPVLHGTFGEDGTVQGLFELAAVPYAGAGVLGSALGMDKVVQKTLWRGMGLPVVDFLSVRRRELERDMDEVLDRVEAAFGYPCFTKPANLGSSVGVRKVRDRGELKAGLEEAARYDAKLLVERAVDARELEVGVLGNDEPIASVVGEILPGADFYDYRAKYLDAGSQALFPAEIPPALADEVRRLAVAAFKAVDAAGLARVDFFLDRTSGQLYLNEINTMPGFTEISMYPKLWAASGISFPELVTRIAELALERFSDRARNQTSLRIE
jgi:D-alanine-D-alanine ligase